MKKLSIVLAIIAVFSVSACNSCSSNKGKTAEEQGIVIPDDVKLQLDTLVKTLNQVGPIQTIKADKVSLSENEKKVKPDYLLSPSLAENTISLSKQHALFAMLFEDMTVAELYDMPTDGYKKAVAKLAITINDKSLTDHRMKAGETANAIIEVYNSALENGTLHLWLEQGIGSTIESLFILTQNLEKLPTLITDNDVFAITQHLYFGLQNLKLLMPYYEELKPISEVMDPLNVLTAITVSELQEQLLPLKDQVTAARTLLITE